MSVVAVASLLVAAAALGAPSERSILRELQGLDRSLVSAEEGLMTLEARRDEIDRELARIEAELAATRVRRREAFDLYRRRVRALASMPSGARLVILGGARSLADYLESSRVLRWVARHDVQLQHRYMAEVRRLEGLERELEQRRTDQAELVAKARVERDAIAMHREERLQLLQSVAADRGLQDLVRRERGAARTTLSRTIEMLEPKGRPAQSFAGNRGRLPWPASGDIDVSFGQQVEHAYGTVTSHNGVDIRAQAGSPVQSVAAGRVAFADWLEGYGRLVIIDHGDHYHSLAAHLGRVEVAVGDEVQQGTVLGTVGDTGSMDGTVLYFEIRERGVPVDPLGWLRR